MGRGGRIACIATPFILTAASLAALILIFLAGTVKNNAQFGNLYFIKMNFTNVNFTNAANTFAPGVNLTAFNATLSTAKQQLNLKDFYTVYLTNFCSWNVGEDPYSNCTAAERPFAFDPLAAWGIDQAAQTLNINVTSILPDELEKGIQLYTKLSHAMFYVYVIGAVTLVATMLVGISAMFSRWGSFITTFFVFVASLSSIIASAMASAMFVALKGVLITVMDQTFETKTTLGQRVYILTWIGAGLGFIAFQFWAWSICCCSGRSPYYSGDAKRTRAEKTPYTYERVASPMPPSQPQSIALNPVFNLGNSGYSNPPPQVPQNHMRSTAYEPFRGEV